MSEVIIIDGHTVPSKDITEMLKQNAWDTVYVVLDPSEEYDDIDITLPLSFLCNHVPKFNTIHVPNECDKWSFVAGVIQQGHASDSVWVMTTSDEEVHAPIHNLTTACVNVIYKDHDHEDEDEEYGNAEEDDDEEDDDDDDDRCTHADDSNDAILAGFQTLMSSKQGQDLMMSVMKSCFQNES